MTALADSRALERLEAKFTPEPNTGCWLWTAAAGHGGYGCFHLNGRRVGAHRAAYLLLVGPIPEGLQLDHLCRTPACVNPDHLEPVTRHENILRGRMPLLERTHCRHGHEYTAENAFWCLGKNGRPYRRCRECRRFQWRAHYYRQPIHKRSGLPRVPKGGAMVQAAVPADAALSDMRAAGLGARQTRRQT